MNVYSLKSVPVELGWIKHATCNGESVGSNPTIGLFGIFIIHYIQILYGSRRVVRPILVDFRSTNVSSNLAGSIWKLHVQHVDLIMYRDIQDYLFRLQQDISMNVIGVITPGLSRCFR
jgi:hypothetical protein